MLYEVITDESESARNRGKDRSADRPGNRNRTHGADLVPATKKQSPLRRRCRRRQDGARRGIV